MFHLLFPHLAAVQDRGPSSLRISDPSKRDLSPYLAMPSDRSPSDDEKRLPSDDEKRVSLDHHNGGAEVDGLPADPDAHLSEEEKAKIVRQAYFRTKGSIADP